MKKLFVCLLAMLMLVGCSSSNQTTTTETTTPETTTAAEETTTAEETAAPTVEVNDEMYAAYLDSYYSQEHSTDYTASDSTYMFMDQAEADLTLVSSRLQCEITEDEAVLTTIQEHHTEQVAAFEELLRSFAPTLDETASYDNAKTIIMFKDASKNLMYINSDGYVKIVMGDARGVFAITADELNSLVEFLDNYSQYMVRSGVCGASAE